MNEVGKAAWQAFKNVTKSVLGNYKAENYHEIVSNLLIAYKAMGCNMSLKVHFLDSHLDFFLENLGAVSDEHGERFHQDSKIFHFFSIIKFLYNKFILVVHTILLYWRFTAYSNLQEIEKSKEFKMWLHQMIH
jgi:hypothetical protein